MEESNRLKVILDTSVMMEDCFSWIEENWQKYEFIIVNVMRSELNGLKDGKDSEKRYKARKALKFIKNNIDKFTFANHPYLSSLSSELYECTVDNILLDTCISRKAAIATNDINIIIDALLLDIEVVNVQNGINGSTNYKGYTEVTMTDYEMANFYECQVNKWDLAINEYLLIKNENGEVVDKLRWTEQGFEPVKYKVIDNRFTGKIKPRNLHQELAFDMLQDDTIKVKLITGSFGVGKDYLMLSDALNKVEKGKYEKIIWVRNTWGVKNSKDIGFLPGDANDKLMPYAMVLSDIVGGQYGMDYLMQNNKLELQHLSSIRGRNFTNSIIYCTEAENMTKEHLQIILSRLGENSCIYINGDYKQSDDKIFEHNSGINALKDKLKGNPLFGYVELEKTERSKVADLAKLLD